MLKACAGLEGHDDASQRELSDATLGPVRVLGMIRDGHSAPQFDVAVCD